MKNMNVSEVGKAVGAADIPDYVSARVLAANTAEQITIPAYAVIMKISLINATHYLFGTNPTATVPTDTDDGTACELLPPGVHWLRFPQGTAKVSVISASNGLMTASFFRE